MKFIISTLALNAVLRQVVDPRFLTLAPGKLTVTNLLGCEATAICETFKPHSHTATLKKKEMKRLRGLSRHLPEQPLEIEIDRHKVRINAEIGVSVKEFTESN